jgi:hypothetical protein
MVVSWNVSPCSRVIQPSRGRGVILATCASYCMWCDCADPCWRFEGIAALRLAGMMNTLRPHRVSKRERREPNGRFASRRNAQLLIVSFQQPACVLPVSMSEPRSSEEESNYGRHSSAGIIGY